MSVRAYRIIGLQTEDAPSFNLWSDGALTTFLEVEAGIYEHLASDGTGMTEIPISVLRKAVKKAAELNIDEETVNQLKKDIAAAKSSKDEYVSYYCC